MATRKPIVAELEDSTTIPFEFAGDTFYLKKKFKRLKFLRLITSNPMEALQLVFADGELARLEEIDMDDQDLTTVIEMVSDTLVGSKN